MRTKFCGNNFLGKGFRKTSADSFFLNSDVASGEGGSGEESSACSIRFILAKLGADKNPKYIISQNCLGYFSASGCPSLKEISPRHSPRVFPLGLRAPRLLCVLLFLALPLCRAGARAGRCLGEERNPSPSFGLLLAVVC